MYGKDAFIERVALEHGRVHVKGGFADGLTRVTVPNGHEWVVNDDGHVIKERTNFSVDWKEEPA